MLRTLLYAAVFLFAASIADPGKKGSPDEANTAAVRGQFPHQVSIGITFKNGAVTKKLEHHCSGSILSKNWVITAATCFKFTYTDLNKKEISINPSHIQTLHLTVGLENLARYEYSKQTFDIAATSQNLVIHDKYGDKKEAARSYDFALIKVPSEGISFYNGFVEPIGLVKQGEDPRVGTQSTVAGWGYSGILGKRVSDQLLFVKIPIKPDQSCKDTYQNSQYRYWDPSTKICAGGNADPHKSVCQGDSGSALEVTVGGKRKLAGVISTGGKCDSINPIMVSRVSKVLGWITQKTGIKTA